MSAGAYIKSLDGVRALSIIFVLLAHAAPLGPKDWLLNSVSGRLGMTLFFCLSGYLITSMLYRSPNIYEFVVKRVFRIVPCMALYLLILWLFFGLPTQSLVLNLLFVSNYLTDGLSGGPVGHLWSLCVEMHFYLVVSLVVWIGGARALWLIPIAAVIVTGLRVQGEVVASINTHLRVDEILAGGILALISAHYGDQLRRSLAHKGLATAVLLILCTLLLVSCHDKGGFLVYLRPYFTLATVGVVMHCNLRTLLTLLEGRVAGYIAKISYALYVYHPLMIFGWMNAGSTFERYILKRPVSVVLMLAASHASTFWWERWWQDFARTKLLRKKAP